MKSVIGLFLAFGSIAVIACSGEAPVENQNASLDEATLHKRAEEIYTQTLQSGGPVIPEDYVHVKQGTESDFERDSKPTRIDAGPDLMPPRMCVGDTNYYGVCCGYYCDGYGACGHACCTYVYGDRLPTNGLC